MMGRRLHPPGTFIQSDIISVPNNPDVGFDLLTRPAEVLMLQHVLIFLERTLHRINNQTGVLNMYKHPQ